MTFIKYQHFNMRASSYALIDRINLVIDEFQSEGYTATLRQIYYQLVQMNIIENTMQSYDNLGILIKKAKPKNRLQCCIVAGMMLRLLWISRKA